MNAVSSIPGLNPAAFGGVSPLGAPGAGGLPGGLKGAGEVGGAGFGDLLGKVVDVVQTRQAESAEATRAVMSGQSDQVHSAMIAMQESSVAFTLMIETRNRLVESYQELMRMPV